MPRKNIRRFASFDHGLIEIKLGQLLACALIDHVVLSTNDEEIMAFAKTFQGARLSIHRRPEHLATSETSTDELVAHARELIDDGHILWTHVTSPFVNAAEYSDIIAVYRRALQDGYDSLMTTTPLQSFIWNDEGPVNYDRSVEKWPRTQTLTPVSEVNSAVFLASAEIYARHEDRIGVRPMLCPLGRFAGLDVDWEEDFVIAEQLVLNKLVSI